MIQVISHTGTNICVFVSNTMELRPSSEPCYGFVKNVAVLKSEPRTEAVMHQKYTLV